jgi:hypothetical protein
MRAHVHRLAAAGNAAALLLIAVFAAALAKPFGVAGPSTGPPPPPSPTTPIAATKGGGERVHRRPARGRARGRRRVVLRAGLAALDDPAFRLAVIHFDPRLCSRSLGGLLRAASTLVFLTCGAAIVLLTRKSEPRSTPTPLVT